MIRLCIAFLVLFPSFSFADFSGQVVSVLDGDTIEVLFNQRPERIRLSGIDCPEKGQAYGSEPSKPPQLSPLERKSSSRHAA